MWYKKDFIKQKGVIIKYFEKKGVSKENISNYSATTGIPIIVVCEFIKEEFPEHVEMCDGRIAIVKKFFNIRD